MFALWRQGWGEGARDETLFLEWLWETLELQQHSSFAEIDRFTRQALQPERLASLCPFYGYLPF